MAGLLDAVEQSWQLLLGDLRRRRELQWAILVEALGADGARRWVLEHGGSRRPCRDEEEQARAPQEGLARQEQAPMGATRQVPREAP